MWTSLLCKTELHFGNILDDSQSSSLGFSPELSKGTALGNTMNSVLNTPGL